MIQLVNEQSTILGFDSLLFYDLYSQALSKLPRFSRPSNTVHLIHVS